MINRLSELYIFEKIPEEQRIQDNGKWWRGGQQGKQVPYAFVRSFLRTTDIMMGSIALWIAFTNNALGPVRAGIELLFVGSWALLLFSRRCSQFVPATGMYVAAIGLSLLLNLVFPGMWGNVVLYMLCVTVLYRFPLGWALLLAGGCILALIATGGALQLLLVRHPGGISGTLAISLALAAGLAWFGWTRRAQYLLVVRLHETQAQLREQMLRSEELAAERERTRIARDIHDVLSHSLAVLSIQVQAARQLVTRDPERLATKLDDMATLIRESIAESRRVVGLLREKPLTADGQETLAASLQSMAATFNERTGIHCRFEESGVPRTINSRQRETLQQALREMLTNAHRHGAAKTVWITIRWREASVSLVVCDDGAGENASHAHMSAQELGNGVGGHHGLEGMRERAAELGGEVEAGPAATGGFMVTLRLPYEQSDERAVKIGNVL